MINSLRKITQRLGQSGLIVFACVAVLCLLGSEPLRYGLEPARAEATVLQEMADSGEEQSSETLLLNQTVEAVVPAIQLSPQHFFVLATILEYFSPVEATALKVSQQPPLMLYSFFKILFRDIISPNAP